MFPRYKKTYICLEKYVILTKLHDDKLFIQESEKPRDTGQRGEKYDKKINKKNYLFKCSVPRINQLKRVNTSNGWFKWYIS
ncbi:hypothetical protein Hanom_Chr04g00367881 [Helianthus anomalus]